MVPVMEQILRRRDAAKGEHGRLLILAGEERYAGAARHAARAAYRSGVDSVLILATEKAAPILATDPDWVVQALPGERLEAHLDAIAERAATATALLAGPGLGRRPDFLRALLSRIRCPLILAADAVKDAPLDALKECLLVANAREAALLAERHALPGALGSNLLLITGPEDRLLTSEGEERVSGGHPRAAVAGTGDVLAGLAAGLRAQGLGPAAAGRSAAEIAKRAAERLGTRLGYGWLASELADEVAPAMQALHAWREA